MSIDHSKSPITVTIGGVDYAARPVNVVLMLEMIDWANHRERKAQLELIAPKTAVEAAEALKIIGKPYTIENMNALLEEPMVLFEIVWRCLNRANPELERETCMENVHLLDMPRLTQVFNELSGFGETAEDPTPAAGESEKKSTDSAKPSPPSASATT